MNHKLLLKSMITILGLALLSWAALLRPDYFLLVGIFTFIPGYLLLALSLTPLGTRTLSSQNALPLGVWLWKLIKAQLAVGVLTVGAATAFFGSGPDYVQGQISWSMAVSSIQQGEWIWGIFPWGIYGIWALLIAEGSYTKDRAPYLYQIGAKVCPHWLQPAVKAFVELSTSGATLMVLCLSMASLVLLFTDIIQIKFQIQHFSVPFLTITALSFATFLLFFPVGKRWMRRFNQKNKSLNRLIALIISVFVIALVLASWMNQWFVAHYAAIYTKMVCHQCGNYFANIAIGDRFAVLYWGWWLAWTPLAGSYIAKISQGRSVREVVLGLYLVPGLIVLALIWKKPLLLAQLERLQTLPSMLVLLLMAVLVGYCLSKMLKGVENTRFF